MNDLEFFLAELERSGEDGQRTTRSITLRQYAGYWLGRAGADKFKEAVEEFNAKPNGSWQKIEELTTRNGVAAVIKDSPYYAGVFALSVVYFRLDDSAQRLFLFVSRLVPEWNLNDKHPHQGMRVLIHVTFLLYDWADFFWKWKKRLIWTLSDKELRKFPILFRYLSVPAINRVVSRITFVPTPSPRLCVGQPQPQRACDQRVRHLLRVLAKRQFVRHCPLKSNGMTAQSAERKRRTPTPFAAVAHPPLCTAIEKLIGIYYAIVHGVFFAVPDVELPRLAHIVNCMTGGKPQTSAKERAKKRDTSLPGQLVKGVAYGLPGDIGIAGLSAEQSQEFARIARSFSQELEMCRRFGDAKEVVLLLLLSTGSLKKWVDPGARVTPDDWAAFLQHLRSIGETIPHLVAALPLFKVREPLVRDWIDIRSQKIAAQNWSDLCLIMRSFSDTVPGLAEAMSLLELPVPLLKHLLDTWRRIAATPPELPSNTAGSSHTIPSGQPQPRDHNARSRTRAT